MTPRTRGQILDKVRFALALSACLAGCLSKPTFECADNSACTRGGTQGTCQPDKLCSFPDGSCASGQRYGELSGPQANQCVGDVPADASDAGVCLGGGAYTLCVTPPSDPVMIAGAINTDTDPRCATPPAQWVAAGQPDACVIAGAITVGNATVTGTKPLVLAGATVAIDGTVDLASHRGGATGPGAPFAGCAPFAGDPENNNQGAGGGAGASFTTLGGNGARGENVTVEGGVAAPIANASVLRAGCGGQTGGTGQAAAGTRGQGGGAIFITAAMITFASTGAINASGAGGTGGGPYSGGSGGGSGGMIVLHAPSITGVAGARLVANGGGGAAGASGFSQAPSGSDPNPATPTSPASGGSGGTGGVGGSGFAGTMQAQSGQFSNQNRGGGGGGGGAGYIQSNIALAPITSSPSATVVP